MTWITYPLSYRRQSQTVPALGKAIAPTVRTALHSSGRQMALAEAAAGEVKAGLG